MNTEFWRHLTFLICDVAYADAEEHEGEDSVRGTVRETHQGAQAIAAIQITAVCRCYKSHNKKFEEMFGTTVDILPNCMVT